MIGLSSSGIWETIEALMRLLEDAPTSRQGIGILGDIRVRHTENSCEVTTRSHISRRCRHMTDVPTCSVGVVTN